MPAIKATNITVTMPVPDVPGVDPANQMRWDLLDLCRACGADADLSYIVQDAMPDDGIIEYNSYGLCKACR